MYYIQNVKLTFTVTPEAVLSRPVTTYKVTEKEAKQCYQVAIHDIYSEEERCILATVSLPANQAIQEPTSVAVVTCKVEFFDVLSCKPSESEVTLNVVRNRALQNPIPSDAKDDIELHRIRCQVASTLGEASTLASSGNIPAARNLLLQMQGRVAGSVVAAKPLAAHLVHSMGVSLEGLQDKVSQPAMHGAHPS